MGSRNPELVEVEEGMPRVSLPLCIVKVASPELMLLSRDIAKVMELP